MTQGTVKFFNETKGFGFIINEETKEELFVHISEVEGGDILEGDIVEYQEGEGKKGPMATNVTVVERPEQD